MYKILSVLLGLELLSIVILDYFCFNDFERSINNTATIIQSIAIIIGAVWAVREFYYKRFKDDHRELKRIVNSFDIKLYCLFLEYKELKKAGSNCDIKQYKERSKTIFIDAMNELKNLNLHKGMGKYVNDFYLAAGFYHVALFLDSETMEQEVIQDVDNLLWSRLKSHTEELKKGKYHFYKKAKSELLDAAENTI